MQPRRPITGPILLMVIGFIFLLHNLRPTVPLFSWFSSYWPYVLIGWGVLQLTEVLIRFGQSRPVPVNGVSGPAWFLVVMICLFGFAGHEFRRPNPWWQGADFLEGFESFGRGHEFSIATQQRAVGTKPKLIIETFRGDAKITVGEAQSVSLTGRKTIHAASDSEAANVNSATAVELLMRGDTVVVRCHQDPASNHGRVTTDLELVVPKDTSVEATGQLGDFDITGLGGSVDISSDNAGVRLQDIGGPVTVQTRKSDIVRCVGIRGPVHLSGHGDDVEVSRVEGALDLSGSFTGRISLREITDAVHLQNFRTEFTLRRLPGELHLERGELGMKDVTGPVRLNARATDVRMEGFSDGLDLHVDKGDIELRPVHLPLSQMIVRTSSGNIDLDLAPAAGCSLQASTAHGEIENEWGGGLEAVKTGQGSVLRGAIGSGSGPQVRLETSRGSINLRRSDGAPLVTTAAKQDSDDDR